MWRETDLRRHSDATWATVLGIILTEAKQHVLGRSTGLDLRVLAERLVVRGALVRKRRLALVALRSAGAS